MRALLIALLAALFLLAPSVVQAQTPDEVVSIIQEAAGRHGVSSASLVAIARCETGGTFNPSVRGDSGTSWGLFQLHSPGLRDTFYAQGYSDPFNAWEASDFAARAISNGMRSHWHC